MCVGVIKNCFNSLSPSSKFFLLLLVKKQNLNKPIIWNYKNLTKEYGVSDNVVKIALKSFIFNDVLSPVEPQIKRRGRPSKCYKFNEKFIRKYINAVEIYCKHSDLIDLLLRRDSESKTLRLSNRLLLIVLLSVADEFGVSNEFGNSELCKLTGMKSDGLKSQINKLKELGFINSHVKGGSGKYLFGVTPSTYFIDLSHPKFSLIKQKTAKFICSLVQINEREDRASPVMACRELSRSIDYFRSWYQSGIKKNQIIERNKERWEELNYKSDSPVRIDDYEEFQNIACFLVQKWKNPDINILQCKLNKYTSYFLSNYFDDLTDEEKLITDELIADIKPSLLPIGILKAIESGNEYNDLINSTKQVEQLCQYILRVAILIAQNIKNVLSKNTDIEFNKYNFSVRPNFYQNNIYFVIDSSISVNDNVYYLYEYRVRNNGCAFIEEILTISDEEKTTFGLLCNSNKKETDWGKLAEAKEDNDDV